jgi:hypothetical protein
MAKKRKLNSKNPIYNKSIRKEGPAIKKRTKICDVPIRNASGRKTGDTAQAWGVFYED